MSSKVQASGPPQTSHIVLSRVPLTSFYCARSKPVRRKLGRSVCALRSAVPPLLADSISSASNPYVKHCVRLRTSRGYRQDTQRLLLSGLAPLTELATACCDLQVWTLFVSGGPPQPGLPAADRVVTVTPPVMRKLAGLDSPPSGVQVAAEVALPPPMDFATVPSLRRLLVLDGIQDPGNLGTLMRTATALGWSGCFLLPGCCDVFNDKALRAGRGAAFKLPHAAGGWPALQRIVEAHGLTLLAAQLPDAGVAAHGSARQPLPPGSGICLVMGSEGQGLSAAAMEACRPVSVPMEGDMESLNVAVAGAILMFALSRAPGSVLS